MKKSTFVWHPGLSRVLAAATLFLLAGRPTTAADLTLAEAIEQTRLNSPRNAVAEAQSSGRFGLWQEQLGRFDWTVGTETRFTRDRSELTRTQLVREEDRRRAERILISEFTRIADDLERQLEEATGRPLPDCRTFLLIVDGELVCEDTLTRTNQQRLDDLLAVLIEITEDPARRAELEGARNRILDFSREQAANLIIVLRRKVEEARIRLERLGIVPDTQQRYTFRFDTGISRLFPNGLAVSAGVTISGFEDNFEGKPLRAGFGGKGIPRTYRSFLGLGLDIPLGRGRGARATAAAARAAELGYQASRFTREDQAREAELETVRAYWQLAAAQERLTLLEQAVETAKAMTRDVGDLAKAGELATVEEERAAARAAAIELERARAERELQQARARLADSMGAVWQSPEEAPVAIDPLPTSGEIEGEPLAPRALVEAALGRRTDLEAARRLQQAAEVLQEGSRRNQQREIDLSLSLGYAGLYESFDDQLLAPGAYWEALSGRQTGPGFSILLKTRAPFANRQARGQFEQASALATRSAIESGERERQIALEVSDALGAWQAAVAEITRRRLAREGAAEVFDAARDLLRASEGTTIDLLVTDETRLQAEITELAARENLAEALAFLRFSLGLSPAGGLPEMKDLAEASEDPHG